MFKKKNARHKLAVIGDSLSQGFLNGGIYRTDINFPSFLASCFEPQIEFRQPVFTAQAGIPLNFEVLLRGLTDEFGEFIDWTEYSGATAHTLSTLRRIKYYWEGRRKNLSVDQPEPWHNQSVWGLAVNDAWLLTEKSAREFIDEHTDRFSVFGFLPEHAKLTTARLVLNPQLTSQHEHQTQLSNIQRLQDDGGIENLIVCLGHNNALGSVVNLKLKWSEPDDLNAFMAHRSHSIYRPEHFELEYRQLAERIHAIGAQRVFAPTLPYPTIPPVLRGVNSAISHDHLGYFDYYTRFWIWDEDFNPEKHPHLTRDEAIQIDLTVDSYNEIIRKVAAEYDWHVVPMAEHVGGMAYRRLGGRLYRYYPPEFIRALRRHPMTHHLVDEQDNVLLTTDFIRSDPESGRISKGGLFSLDGLHPTTTGYGLMASVYHRTMKKAGVRFQRDIDWDRVIREDTLITNPPALLAELKLVLRYLSLDHSDRIRHLGKGLAEKVLEMIATGRME
jgi:hypothetical protein